MLKKIQNKTEMLLSNSKNESILYNILNVQITIFVNNYFKGYFTIH